MYEHMYDMMDTHLHYNNRSVNEAFAFKSPDQNLKCQNGTIVHSLHISLFCLFNIITIEILQRTPRQLNSI